MYVELRIDGITFFVRSEILANSQIGNLGNALERTPLVAISDFVVNNGQLVKCRATTEDLVRAYIEQNLEKK